MAYIAEGQIIGARAIGSVKAPVVVAETAFGAGFVAGGSISAGSVVAEAHAPFLGPVTIEVVAPTTPTTGQRWPR